MILEDRTWTKVHRRHFLLDLCRSDLLSFVSEFKSMNTIEGYVQGNYVLQVIFSLYILPLLIADQICGATVMLVLGISTPEV